MRIPKSSLRDFGKFVNRPGNLHFNSPPPQLFLTIYFEKTLPWRFLILRFISMINRSKHKPIQVPRRAFTCPSSLFQNASGPGHKHFLESWEEKSGHHFPRDSEKNPLNSKQKNYILLQKHVGLTGRISCTDVSDTGEL